MNVRQFSRLRWSPRRHTGNCVGKKEVWGELPISLDLCLVLRYLPFAGWMPVCVRQRGGAKQVVREYQHWEQKQMRKRSKDTVAAVPAGGALVDLETTLLKSFPLLMQQMGVIRYDDDTERKPGSLFISTQGSVWRVTVTEPDECLKLGMVAQRLDDAMAGMELMLGSESIPWEIDAYALSRRPKNTKK